MAQYSQTIFCEDCHIINFKEYPVAYFHLKQKPSTMYLDIRLKIYFALLLVHDSILTGSISYPATLFWFILEQFLIGTELEDGVENQKHSEI